MYLWLDGNINRTYWINLGNCCTLLSCAEVIYSHATELMSSLTYQPSCEGCFWWTARWTIALRSWFTVGVSHPDHPNPSRDVKGIQPLPFPWTDGSRLVTGPVLSEPGSQEKFISLPALRETSRAANSCQAGHGGTLWTLGRHDGAENMWLN